jgi:hypothetical protein
MAVAQAGDFLCVRWLSLDDKEEEHQVEVTNVRFSKSGHDKYCYSLLFSDGETRKTKILGSRIVTTKKPDNKIVKTKKRKLKSLRMGSLS